MNLPSNCENCIHWQRNDENFGDCRKPLPVLGDEGRGVWPSTESTDWCSHQVDAPLNTEGVLGRPVDRKAYDRLLALIAKHVTGPAQAKGRSQIWRCISAEAGITNANFYRIVAALVGEGRLVAEGRLYYTPIPAPEEID